MIFYYNVTSDDAICDANLKGTIDCLVLTFPHGYANLMAF
jgi:hypothetical protein